MMVMVRRTFAILMRSVCRGIMIVRTAGILDSNSSNLMIFMHGNDPGTEPRQYPENHQPCEYCSHQRVKTRLMIA